jgi:hypothetical protein
LTAAGSVLALALLVDAVLAAFGAPAGALALLPALLTSTAASVEADDGFRLALLAVAAVALPFADLSLVPAPDRSTSRLAAPFAVDVPLASSRVANALSPPSA